MRMRGFEARRVPRASPSWRLPMKRIRRFGGLMSLAAVSAGVLVATPTLAEVPQLLMHQGRLYEDNGAPLDATLDVKFAIYDTPAADVPLWEETHTITFE